MSVALVLDTDVMVAAFRSASGASRELLLAALKQRFQICISIPLMLEYEAVLTRQEHLDESRASKSDVLAVLDDLAVVTKPVRLAFRWRPILSDANDDMVLETAINGDADAIVTFNKKDFRAAENVFRCEVILPKEALVRVRSSFHEEK